MLSYALSDKDSGIWLECFQFSDTVLKYDAEYFTEHDIIIVCTHGALVIIVMKSQVSLDNFYK